MRKFVLTFAVSLIALASASYATTETSSSTTTTTETPTGTTTTTTDTTTVAPTAPAPAPTPEPPKSTARDAISGQAVDPYSSPKKEEKSLRDSVREKISDEARGK
ncbi:MAG: hypothetical protein DI551_07825 [Micavibrio aeruginosavorus]|uniref:Uncharacterized protein n=1 Tax=Micavibrio aeruginosavorus TaxID=349221 RepID=A0A2W5MVF9_9BACT|nr:MAG: hypothetical protein DI551_07825 [Micavibrio aeruginosavorus]